MTGIIVIHVDDFAFCGDKTFQVSVIDELKKVFKIGHEANGTFKYLGLNVSQNKGEISVDQEQYIPTVTAVSLSANRMTRKDDEMTMEERKELKRLSGQMMWISTRTRPDLCFKTCAE